MIDIDKEAESLIKNTPAKSEGVELSDLLKEKEINQKSEPDNQKKLKAKEYQREYQKRYREQRKLFNKTKTKPSAAPEPKGLFDAIEQPKPQKLEADFQSKKKIPPQVSARIINTGYESVLRGFLGDHVEFTGHERIALDEALMEYLAVNDYEVPPFWAMVFVYGTVTASKIQQPKSKERLAGFIGYLRGKFKRKKAAQPEKSEQ